MLCTLYYYLLYIPNQFRYARNCSSPKEINPFIYIFYHNCILMGSPGWCLAIVAGCAAVQIHITPNHESQRSVSGFLVYTYIFIIVKRLFTCTYHHQNSCFLFRTTDERNRTMRLWYLFQVVECLKAILIVRSRG